MWKFDHLVVAAERLEDGVAYVEDALGIALDAGGRHDHMGTWNKVVSMGPGEYLEVIAVDPNAQRPERARWFGLDQFSGPPRLITWVARVTGLAAELGNDLGRPLHLTRGDFSWSFGLNDSGSLAFDGAHPCLIEWDGPHPSDRMEDKGLRMTSLKLSHPSASLADRMKFDDERIQVKFDQAFGMVAAIDTPGGTRCLTS